MSNTKRTSYSQNNTYIQCPKHWYWKYKEKLVGPEEGASLSFGTAVDNAVMALLEGKPNYMDIFERNMLSQWNFGKVTQVFDNPDIVYSHADFDEYILEQEDIDEMEKWAVDLKLVGAASQPSREDLIDLMKQAGKDKKNPYKRPTQAQMLYFNRCSWLSLKRKGYLLIEAFKVQFLPKVKSVVATQERASIKDPSTGDSIQGYIDMVLEIEGYDKPVIFDLKTAARPYTDEQIELGTQLTLYAGMNGGKYTTDLVGYVVLCKNIEKLDHSSCKSCGHVKTGRHRTCDNMINGKRCDGEWQISKIPKPNVQVLVRQKTQQEINDLFMDVGNILVAMKQEIIYKDTSKCNNWYGGRCPYYNACHKNDTSGLVKK